MHPKHYEISKIEKLPDSEAQITGEITLPFLVACRAEALKNFKKTASLPGFREGHVPDDVLVRNIGEMRLLEETAEIALGKEYPNIILESKLKPIARPEIAVTKMVPGSPLEFKALVVLEPEFDLPDYKKIAKEVPLEKALKPEEETKMREKRRLKMIENLIKETKIEVPKRLVEGELVHMLHHFQQDVEKAGIKWEEYLKKIDKKEEEVKETWREHIISRAKTELLLSKIAQKENLDTYQKVFEMLEA
ncbi:MAG: trigger factor [Parcubacteria group bacterium]